MEVKILRDEILKISKTPFSLMEVCGTHTMSLAQYGIRSLIPEHIRVISGPGCPVCVTSASDIQMAIDLAKIPNVVVATFGDMLKVPSPLGESLLSFKNVLICYSPLEALEYAETHPEKELVFLGIGFETTAPHIAATVEQAKLKKIKNFSVLVLHKTVPEALKVILSDPEVKVNSLLLPGHVSVVTGTTYWNFLNDYKISGAIAGFEPISILSSILNLVKNIEEKKFEISNHYKELVHREGNSHALNLLKKVFLASTVSWREIGPIKDSGLDFREEYKPFCARRRFGLVYKEVPPTKGCLCGRILMGKNTPNDCPHFAKTCVPSNPIGPCMVSSEGTCAAYYKYERKN